MYIVYQEIERHHSLDIIKDICNDGFASGDSQKHPLEPMGNAINLVDL